MEDRFNNYALTNEEIESILQKYKDVIKKQLRSMGNLMKTVNKKIKIAIFRKLSRHRNKKN